ncbi:MAG: hypothetical protein PHD40_07945 [Syntrophomonadaceae bacterium]|nr:hypothetical protein [Syntrophomonadaceae bacterium]
MLPGKARFMLVSGYLGAVIGAGFASGQEIVQFFVVYGGFGLKGCILAGALFAILGGVLLSGAHRHKKSNYQNLLQTWLGVRAGAIFDILLALFLFLGISTMLSASGAVFYEHLYLPKGLGVFISYSVVMLLLFIGKKGLIASYNILVPIKIVLLLIISSYLCWGMPHKEVVSFTAFGVPAGQARWALSAILYVAYNFTLAMVVLTEYQTVTSRRDGVIGAMWGGLILGVLVILNYMALTRFMPTVIHYQVPMLYISGQISPLAKNIYTLVLWIGIITTAIANAYGITQRVAHFMKIRFQLGLVVCMTLALPLSMLSFSQLVGTIYPLFGLLGIILMLSLLLKEGKDIVGEIYYNIEQLYRTRRR